MNVRWYPILRCKEVLAFVTQGKGPIALKDRNRKWACNFNADN